LSSLRYYFHHRPSTAIYTLSLHDALPILPTYVRLGTYKILAIAAFTLFGIGLAFYATPSTDAALANLPDDQAGAGSGIYKMASRSEEHTSELQSRFDLVCRLLLEKKKIYK